MQRIILYGLVYACPFDKRQNDCVLSQVEHLSVKEKFKWVEGLKEEEINTIVQNHRRCLAMRENK